MEGKKEKKNEKLLIWETYIYRIINTDIIPQLNDQIKKYTPLKPIALPFQLERSASLPIHPKISALYFSFRYLLSMN